MGPTVLSTTGPLPPGPAWRRPRRCLLKGCERWFQPTRPQCRYCSPACRHKARRWRRWRAQQKYRASSKGRAQRQQQARRYRQRAPLRPPPPPPAEEPVLPEAAPALVQREGKRLLKNPQKVPVRPCDRPGCYVLFAAGSPDHPRRFCCLLCRRALRRVLDRESRRRRRRRRGLRRPGRPARPPPWRRQ